MGKAATKVASANRLVDRFVLHGDPISFRALCERVLPPTTRYLVLDLDRTVHLGRNLGELLGWELGAYEAYGKETLERMEVRRRRTRWAIDLEHPKQLARYLINATTRWAYPGTYYLLWGKAASRIDWLRRRAFRQFAGEPVRAAQLVPQTTLLEHLESASDDVLRMLAARVWNRHQADQVIRREDIEWVRSRCPHIEVILTSASPRAMVEYAGEALGVDHTHYSTLQRINSGEAKIERLREVLPDFGRSGVEVMGMSDTGYGEDHCWAQHFTHVVDINSTDPFPAIVSAESPLREVHSATVLTQGEIRRRDAGDRHYLDPDRSPAVVATPKKELKRPELERLLGGVLGTMNSVARNAEAVAKADISYRLSVLQEASRAMLAQPQPVR